MRRRLRSAGLIRAVIDAVRGRELAEGLVVVDLPALAPE
jgi:hypothetical protein